MARPPLRLSEGGRRLFDLALAGGLCFVGVLGYVTAGMPVEALLTGAQTAPLLWRRSAPWPVFLVVAGASAIQALLVAEPIFGQLGFPIALYSVARWAPRWQGVLALLIGYLGALIASVRWLLGFGATALSSSSITSYVITIGAIVTAAAALGFAGQQRERYVAGLVERAEQAERMAEREIELAARDERSRIAREMHDVVAHGLSVIVVQADGARYAAAQDPSVAVRTLETVAETGRTALTEMRRLLGLLREGDTGVAPQPGLADIRHLVAEARAAGTPVEAVLPEDVVEVPPGVGLASYRIAQEALTNVRKHAGPHATARLELSVGREVVLVVRDDGRGASAPGDGRGLGVLGMRERATAHGGSLEAGPAAGGGFVVSARIPVR